MRLFIHYRRPKDDFDAWSLVVEDPSDATITDRPSDPFGRVWEVDLSSPSMKFYFTHSLVSVRSAKPAHRDPVKTFVEATLTGGDELHLFYVSGDIDESGAPRLLPEWGTGTVDPDGVADAITDGFSRLDTNLSRLESRIYGVADTINDGFRALYGQLGGLSGPLGGFTTRVTDALDSIAPRPTAPDTTGDAAAATLAGTVEAALSKAVTDLNPKVADLVKILQGKTIPVGVTNVAALVEELRLAAGRYQGYARDPGTRNLSDLRTEVDLEVKRLVTRIEEVQDSLAAVKEAATVRAELNNAKGSVSAL
ncbi:hypothetical protein [Jidongwangia harbinensis]|uniref:hypothetical protein n=1 Tax=Jidongwangia harbinensis TaxID=2878561 RepID=UPI001CD9BE91|nr:hypothetical protein [Jidongwangia harbinensis]MCA2213908.1 hypothetical protein [Jidongwangia harbinensis]